MRHALNIIPFVVLLILEGCSSKGTSEEKAADKLFQPKAFIAELDPGLMENSGIIFWKDLIWTFNDSGGANEVYAFNPKTAKIEVVVELLGAENSDWEDIAQDEEHIYIAETGNNAGRRTDLKILVIDKHDISEAAEQKVKASSIQYEYADRKNFKPVYRKHPFDCEALIAMNDSLFVFTKDWVNFKTKVYGMPARSGETHLLSPIDSFDVKGLITGADINDAGELALLGYHDFKSFVWTFKVEGRSFFNSPQLIKLDGLKNAQTEGICFKPDGDLLISCERTSNFNEQIWSIPQNVFKKTVP